MHMSRLFESFEFLDRSWDVRVLENQSLRSVFLWLIPLLLLLGVDTGIGAFQFFRFHHFSWSIVFDLSAYGFIAFRLARMIYRRLPR